MKAFLLNSPTQPDALGQTGKGRHHLSIRIPDLVAFIQDGIAPVDSQQLSSLKAQLVVGRQQDAVLALSHQPDELPAPHQWLILSGQSWSCQWNVAGRSQLSNQHLHGPSDLDMLVTRRCPALKSMLRRVSPLPSTPWHVLGMPVCRKLCRTRSPYEAGSTAAACAYDAAAWCCVSRVMKRLLATGTQNACAKISGCM